MFDILDKYKKQGHFFFKPTDLLDEVCNAPDDRDGVYVVYELKNGRVTLVHIGSSGEKIPGYPIKEGLLGLKTAIISGTESEWKSPRRQRWPVKMLSENIAALDIYWWVTYNGKNYGGDHPEDIKRSLMRFHKIMFGEAPAWNKRWLK
ncbi:hypothetical protein [uncultured Mucilaginibacter sp.]|uniref:hypothetical protein n=1 Tax=uncultured Mucilaginibacter sp. TaxID=797541 RepID=UPI0025DCF3B9|nr:hypothetical protein [uncultured Mucilaginibacter sp.]